MALMLAGLAVDLIIHAQDAHLSASTDLFTLENPGHIVIGIGIVMTAIGLLGAAVAMSRQNRDRMPIRLGQIAVVGTGLLLLGAVIYSVPKAGGHDHGGSSDFLAEIAAGPSYSNLPRDEAIAFVELSLSREGTLEGVDHDGHGGHGLHDHATHSHELTPGEQARLDDQLARATAAVPLYDTVEKALAAGYVQVSNRAEGVGSHWTKWTWVDRPFDPEKPSQLLFDEVSAGKGPELVGFSYWVFSHDTPEGFEGEEDVWHQHFGLCFVDGWLINEEVPDRSQCAGDWLNGSDLWMLHAWIVPGLENRLGVFANVNPRFCERYCE